MNRRSFLKSVIGTAVAVAVPAAPFVWRENADYTIDLSYPPNDVRRYGAKGNGIHDDGPALTAALQWAERQGGAVIYVPFTLHVS